MKVASQPKYRYHSSSEVVLLFLSTSRKPSMIMRAHLIMTNHCVHSLVFVIVWVWKTIFLSASFNDGCLR